VKKLVSVILLLFVTFFSNQVLAELKDLSGKTRTVNDYLAKDKWLVAILWASDCHVCNVEAEQYIQFHEDNKDKHIKMIGISLDGQAKIKDAQDFIKRHEVTYQNLIGEPEYVATMYESLTGGPWIGTPTILVYDPRGVLQAAQPGAVPVELIEEFVQSRMAQAKSGQK
jgi:peroxiredoxin